MRAHHALAVAAAILAGLAIKLIFFAPPTAEAVLLSVKGASMDISQLHRNANNLPASKIHDMSFVSPSAD